MEKAPFVIYGFKTKWEPDPKDATKYRERDMVDIGPIGFADKTRTWRYINELRSVQDISGAADNPAIAEAHLRWNFIKPRYEAWKNGQELPETGTPLSAWNGLTPEQADVFKSKGLKTVEQVAGMTDGMIAQFPFPNMRATVMQAKRFIESADQVKVAASLAQKDDEIELLKEQMKELAEMVAASKVVAEEPAKRGPGRPRKADDQAAA